MPSFLHLQCQKPGNAVYTTKLECFTKYFLLQCLLSEFSPFKMMHFTNTLEDTLV